MHVILSDSEESSRWSRLLRFFVACRLLRMTVNGETLNLGYNSILRKTPIEPGADGRWGRKICGVEQDKEVQALPLLA